MSGMSSVCKASVLRHHQQYIAHNARIMQTIMNNLFKYKSNTNEHTRIVFDVVRNSILATPEMTKPDARVSDHHQHQIFLEARAHTQHIYSFCQNPKIICVDCGCLLLASAYGRLSSENIPTEQPTIGTSTNLS